MGGSFETLCGTSRPCTTAQVGGFVRDCVVGQDEVVQSVVSGKSLAQSSNPSMAVPQGGRPRGRTTSRWCEASAAPESVLRMAVGPSGSRSPSKQVQLFGSVESVSATASVKLAVDVPQYREGCSAWPLPRRRGSVVPRRLVGAGWGLIAPRCLVGIEPPHDLTPFCLRKIWTNTTTTTPVQSANPSA